MFEPMKPQPPVMRMLWDLRGIISPLGLNGTFVWDQGQLRMSLFIFEKEELSYILLLVHATFSNHEVDFLFLLNNGDTT